MIALSCYDRSGDSGHVDCKVFLPSVYDDIALVSDC